LSLFIVYHTTHNCIVKRSQLEIEKVSSYNREQAGSICFTNTTTHLILCRPPHPELRKIAKNLSTGAIFFLAAPERSHFRALRCRLDRDRLERYPLLASRHQKVCISHQRIEPCEKLPCKDQSFPLSET
jgi:hypothetical protein